MPKVNRVYASFYNGVSEQVPELMLETNCKEMINCIPNIVYGLKKRPPLKHYNKLTYREDSYIFHSYDRGEDDEEYIMVATGNYDEPIEVYNRNGAKLTVLVDVDDATLIKDYLSNGTLKGLTVQDRTWVYNKNKRVTLDKSTTTPLKANYRKEAYYWLNRSSNDPNYQYRYAVYLDNVVFQAVGHNSDDAAKALSDAINGIGTSEHKADGVKKTFSLPTTVGSGTLEVKFNDTVQSDDTKWSISGTNLTFTTAPAKDDMVLLKITNTSLFIAEAVGSIIKITKKDGEDFSFSCWDSWGSQASVGWKGEIAKITDLPKDHTFSDTYVQITGNDGNGFSNYYVKWNGAAWEECLDPAADRGTLVNMPLALDRTNIGEFTIKLLDWIPPKVGNEENNPDPTFVDNTITDVFFYKNRLGIASSDSVVLSETANYYNFYIKTVIDVVDNDPIDVAIASNKASKIYYVKPFNNSLYIFTKDSQFEMVSDGFLSPKTVSIDIATNYPMAVNVEPQVINNSLYFISTTGGKQQLREYIKTEKLVVEGLDLNVGTPNYLKEPITSLQVNGVLGYVICTTAGGLLYVYNYKETGKERVQSAWSKWQLLEGYNINNYEYTILDADIVVCYKYENNYNFARLPLDSLETNGKYDMLGITKVPYKSSIKLPDLYPKLQTIGTPKDKMLLKKVTIEGKGNFDAYVYRKDYNKTYVKQHTDTMTQDLDIHIASKVGNVDITISDETEYDFVISSVIVEGLFTPTSKAIK